MAGRFVRSSKYRHVFGRSTRKEQCYDNLRITKNAWDTNLIKVNPSYIAVNWEASGGGAFAVIPIEERGKAPDQIPLFRGHTAAVLDTDWSPFNDRLIASGSDDGKVFIWEVPKGFTLHTDAEEPADVSPVARLTGHSRKVGHVLFNPSAENILASASGDYLIKLWDVEHGAAKLQLKHADIVQSLSWNASGSLLVTTSRDKKLRIWDARQEKPVHEGPGHSGAKASRCVWMGEHDRIATTGFSRMSDRQLGLWDIKNPKEPVGGFEILDSISGVCMPFWDDGTQCLYLAGKGDGNIRYYEYENDTFQYLSEYKSADPQRGVAFLPKRGIDLHENEVMRCFKTVADSYIEPVSFIVPRRAEVFQDDIYPPTVGLKPGLSAREWLGGKDGVPPKISLESVYSGDAVKEVASEYKPSVVSSSSTSAPAAAAKAPEPTKAEPAKPAVAPVSASASTPAPSAASRGPAPTVKDNEKSIANMANKFADEEDESDEDETSSFEEVSKPADRSVAARMEQKTSGPPVNAAPAETKQSGHVPAASYSKPAAATTTTAAPSTSTSTANASADTPKPTQTASGAAEGIKGYLQDIKSTLETQTKLLTTQADQIASLTTEVAKLKALLGRSQ